MNIFFLLAGGLALLAAPAHLWGGETHLKHFPPHLFPPTSQGDGAILRQELRFGWHMATLDLFLAGGLLLMMAFSARLPLTVAHLIALYFMAYSLLILVLPLVTLRRWETIYRLPQWILCLLVAGLAYGGTL